MFRYSDVHYSDPVCKCFKKLKIWSFFAAQSMGLMDPLATCEFDCHSEAMHKVLQRHHCTIKTSRDVDMTSHGTDQVKDRSTEVLVREPVLFELMTSLCLAKLMEVIPANVVCISSLAHQVFMSWSDKTLCEDCLSRIKLLPWYPKLLKSQNFWSQRLL